MKKILGLVLSVLTGLSTGFADTAKEIRKSTSTISYSVIVKPEVRGQPIDSRSPRARFVAIAGTASGPSFTTVGDLDTGIWFPAANTLAFSTGGTERVRVLSNGNVGIGDTTPAALFTVASGDLFRVNSSGNVIAAADATNSASAVFYGQDNGSITSQIFLGSFNANSADGAEVRLRHSRGTVASPTVVNSGDETASLRGQGYTGAAYAANAQISFAVDATPGTGDMPGRIVFLTTPDGSATLSERMRIDSSGNLGIGATSPSNRLNVVVDDASNSSVTRILRLDHTTTGTSAAGIGVELAFISEDSGGGLDGVAAIQAIMTTVTAGSEVGALAFLTASPSMTERTRIDENGTRTIMPSAQTIASGNTIAADACGTLKRITAAGAVTTDTTNTFTAPAAANAGCCMDVCNTGSNTITLDNNANFKSAGGADVVVTADDCLRVCSTGASGVWYQTTALVAN